MISEGLFFFPDIRNFLTLLTEKSEVKMKDISNICSKSQENYIFLVKSLDNLGKKLCLQNFFASEVFKTVID